MNFNLVNNIEHCLILVRDSYPLSMIYYSHLTSAIMSLLVGSFVFIKNKKSLESQLLLALSLVFSLWIFFNLILWTSHNSVSIMFFWSFSGILISLLFILSFYLTFVFINKTKPGLREKLIVGLLFLPVIILTPTEFNLMSFSIMDDCEALEGTFFISYYHLFGLFLSVWILYFAVKKYREAEKKFKEQILLFTIGIEFFLLSFFVSSYIASLIDFYELEFYGIFSMAIFMGFLAYIIVQYKAFDIKLLRAQALIVALIILIGSQFAFIRNPVNRVLTGITLFLATTFGWWLIRTIKADDLKKEELQEMTVKLGEAYSKLKQLDRAKSEFVSIASHQLRTPLTAIKGFISLLLDGSYGKVSVTSRNVLEKVYLSNERLIRLVEDLLNISRIESGRLTFKFEANSIHELMTDIVENMNFAAKNKALYLDYKPLEKEIPPFYFDKDKLREVISNLIDNAIKYTKKGGVTVSVKEVSEISLNLEGRSQNAGAQQFVQVIVSDTGVGIEKGEEKYIFEKFQRGKDISRVHTEGVGLGLYVAQKIVEAHQGKLWAESEGLGHGSRFIVQLKKDFQPPVEAPTATFQTQPTPAQSAKSVPSAPVKA